MLKMLVTVDTVFTADTVEWCPASEDIFGCGTYQLDEPKSIRFGSLMLFSWNGLKLTRLLEDATKDLTLGILDMKWKCSELKSTLATANSNGTVGFLQLERTEDETLSLCILSNANISSDSGNTLHLSLSLDWSKLTNSVAVSDSLGQVCVMELSEGGAVRVKQCWQAHSYEAWIVCYGHTDSILFSGGDDCKLHVWDLRMGTSNSCCFTSKRHTMGVCSLQTHPVNENILASGSYDEKLVLWDTRKMSGPLKEASLGGGIWRIKWNSDLTDLVAAACMHNHFQVLDTHLGSSIEPEVVCQYREHSSLAYGIDWCRKHTTNTTENTSSKHTFTLASCSFYDHSLHLWNMSINCL